MPKAVLVGATLIRQYRFEVLPGQTPALEPSVKLRAATDWNMRLASRGAEPASAA
jgi:hypothetical protein